MDLSSLPPHLEVVSGSSYPPPSPEKMSVSLAGQDIQTEGESESSGVLHDDSSNRGKLSPSPEPCQTKEGTGTGGTGEGIEAEESASQDSQVTDLQATLDVSQ